MVLPTVGCVFPYKLLRQPLQTYPHINVDNPSTRLPPGDSRLCWVDKADSHGYLEPFTCILIFFHLIVQMSCGLFAHTPYPSTGAYVCSQRWVREAFLWLWFFPFGGEEGIWFPLASLPWTSTSLQQAQCFCLAGLCQSPGCLLLCSLSRDNVELNMWVQNLPWKLCWPSTVLPQISLV